MSSNIYDDVMRDLNRNDNRFYDYTTQDKIDEAERRYQERIQASKRRKDMFTEINGILFQMYANICMLEPNNCFPDDDYADNLIDIQQSTAKEILDLLTEGENK